MATNTDFNLLAARRRIREEQQEQEQAQHQQQHIRLDTNDFDVWENSLVIGGGGDAASTRRSVKIPSRLESLRPHALYCFRAGLGTLLASALVFIVGPGVFKGSGRFFAVIIPCLAVGPNVGATMTNVSGVPSIFASIFLSTFLVLGLDPMWKALHVWLCFMGVFICQWAKISVSGLTKKLASGMWVTQTLNHMIVGTSGPGATLDSALGLMYGLLIGYAAALISAFIPWPVFATQEVARKIGECAHSLADTVVLLTEEVKAQARHSPHFVELFCMHLSRLDEATRALGPLAIQAEKEAFGFCSYAEVANYAAFFTKMRFQVKGVFLGLKQRACVSEMYSNYATLRASMEAEELALAEVYRRYLFSLAELDLTSTVAVQKELELQFAAFREGVFQARRAFLQREDLLNRGVKAWSSDEVMFDLFSTYFCLASWSEMREIIVQHQEKPLRSGWVVSPWVSSVQAVISSFAPSMNAQDVPRLFNSLVIAFAVSISSIFVALPSVAAIFPSGVSAAVTCVFIFDDSSFGATVTKSRERLVGIVVGGTFSYVALLTGFNVSVGVIVTVWMTFWVTASLFLIGYDSPATANASIFSVGLAFYLTTGLETFSTVSNYFLANAIGAMILVLVGSLFWIITLTTTRPSIYETMQVFLQQCASSISIMTDRCLLVDADVKDLPFMQPNIDLMKRLLVEVSQEPGFGSAVPNAYALRNVVEDLASLATLIRLIDVVTRGLRLQGGFEELRNGGMLSPDVLAALAELRRVFVSVLQEDTVSMMRMEPNFALGWRSRDIETKFGIFLNKSLLSFPVSAQKSLVASKPVIRYLSFIFCLMKLSELVDRIFVLTFELTASRKRVDVTKL